MFEKMKGYRTVAFNTVMAIAMVLSATGVLQPEQVPGAEALNAFFDNLDAVIGGVAAVVNVWLRFRTDTPVGEKEVPAS